MPLETISRHPESATMLPEIVKIRDCVKGAAFVKAKGQLYLPHPSALDTTSPEAVLRYNQYKANAQFQGIPKQTLRTWVGKIDPEKTQVELPERIDYLQGDVDGDGLKLKNAISQTLANILAVKWHVLVADYQGLTVENQNNVSATDIKKAKLRAVIKQYTRENVFNWHFERINNVMQLSYILLREELESFDPDSMMRTKYNSYLALALDEKGEYYQQRFDDYSDGRALQVGGRHYAKVAKAPLKWLPVSIVLDEPQQAGVMTMELGYLSPIVDLTLHNYVISADKMETLNAGKPTLNYYGVDTNAWDQFKIVNERSYVAVGLAVNLWSKEVTAEYVSAQNDITGYTETMRANDDEMRSLGASFPTDSTVDKTATEVDADSAEQAARLTVAAQCVEDAWRFMLLCCGMFEGLWAQENIESNLDQVVLTMNKEFSKREMSPQKAQQILAAVSSGVITKNQGLKSWVKGGYAPDDYETMVAEMDAGGGMTLGLTGNT
jgi:hypothetical protein